jgi:hypothetical protein
MVKMFRIGLGEGYEPASKFEFESKKKCILTWES